MSDEIDSAPSHLCTTEDAFEQFQSVSMYEEDEYITLSDIVPPQPAVPDLACELGDIPYENEVVLESNLDEQVPEVNSTIEIGSEEPKSPEEIYSAAAHQETVEATSYVAEHQDTLEEPEVIAGRLERVEEPLPTAGHLETVEETSYVPPTECRPSKRGRKRKTKHVPNTEMPTLVPELTTPPSRTTQRRRCRPPTYLNQTRENNITTDSTIYSSEKPNNMPKRTNRRTTNKRISENNDSQADDSPLTKTMTADGKPKNNELDLQIVTSMDINSSESVLQSNILSGEPITSPTGTPIPKKRGRKKKITDNNVSNNVSEENKVMNEQSDLPLDPSNDMTANEKKRNNKRGRPKKSQTAEDTTTENHKIEENSGPMIKEEDDDVDDICLSQLKTNLEEVKDCTTTEAITTTTDVQEGKDNELNSESVLNTNDDIKIEEETPTKRNSKMPIMADFEYNIDSIVHKNNVTQEEAQVQLAENDEPTDSLLVEDTSKRPVRRKARQTLHYDEESDEDPFANVELSDDDESMRGRKGRYYSDDEYVPGLVKKRGSKHIDHIDSESSDSDIDNSDEEIRHIKRKISMKLEGSPSKKRGRKPKEDLESMKIKPEVSTLKPNKENMIDDDIEVCLDTSVIQAPERNASWTGTNEFENFIAKKIQGTDIKIKKSTVPVQPLEIPVINSKEAKKINDKSTQTAVSQKSAAVQTTTLYDVPMKDNVPLTPEQSEKACEFLNSIVKTTAELGQLMTQKSEDFIKKKINTAHVTDTFKMDYCVRKSFLLFKLAKHNLMQMEEDLANQYDTFLNTHNLSHHREKPKVFKMEDNAKDSDSDCEIIETPAVLNKPKKAPAKPAFNPKTVFLNKELSIKIAKKPTDDKKSDDKKLNIKGRHTVWINDSVMVKKVKPTQSFLAQDSRNKKPPDYVTVEMVNAFFEQYYRQKALVACAPFVTSEWVAQESLFVCGYFFSSSDDYPKAGIPSASGHCEDTENNISDVNDNFQCSTINTEKKFCPSSLFSLCTKVLRHHFHPLRQNISPENDETALSKQNNPASLYRLCLDIFNTVHLGQGQKEISEDINYDSASSLISESDVEDIKENPEYESTITLKSICHKKVVELLCIRRHPLIIESNPIWTVCKYEENIINNDLLKTNIRPVPYIANNRVKSLFSQCFDSIHSHLNYKEDEVMFTPDTLKYAACKCVMNLINKKLVQGFTEIHENTEEFHYPSHGSLKNVKTLSHLCFEIVTRSFAVCANNLPEEGLTINAVNTLTEEAYHNIEQSELSENEDDYYADADYDDETESGFDNLDEIVHAEEDNHADDNNWLSQVQMQVSSCFNPEEPINNVEEQINDSILKEPTVARIKIEPLEEVLGHVANSPIVKTEPLHNLDEMTIIPESVVTKTEFPDAPATSRGEPIQRQNSSSYDVDSFESFVSTNKMMCNANNYNNDDDDDVFSQSALRIRRQFEPDYLQFDTDIDMNMSLLIPQTFEPMPVIEKKPLPVIENKAKDILMESSSDESSSNNNKKTSVKKKPEKRGRKPKKIDPKTMNNKDLQKEKPPAPNEVAILTRRMRDKIRQEEKKIVSSDSDNDSANISAKKGKEKVKENTEKVKTRSSKVEGSDTLKENTKDGTVKIKSKDSLPVGEEIQCSNVDSTEQVAENCKVDRTASPSVNNFTGFTAVDQNEISSYQKYVKFVYDQILPKVTDQAESASKENHEKPLINPDEPVELLECEPTIPFLMEEASIPSKPTVKKIKPSKKVQNNTNIEQNDTFVKQDQNTNNENPPYVERHGWKCYPLTSNDCKLYQNAQIVLEKLPESFVDTYFRYQDVTKMNLEDEEVDKLINLQTLNRPLLKEVKCKGRPKCKILPDGKNPEKAGSNESDEERDRSVSPAGSERYDELTPSEDEGEKVEDEPPLPVTKPTTENYLAKNSLMDDNESEDESRVKIKEEPKEPGTEASEIQSNSTKKYKPGPKSKKKAKEPPAPVMLTADKMMNKELNLLHAPIKLDEEIEKIETPANKGPATRKQKSTSKTSPKDRAKGEDDSSSEEEKQWFTIKEKLLKRMVKKHDTTREDDAKRAKLVSEFITRRGDGTESYLNRRRGGAGRPKRSRKRMLERQKQLKVLTRELFGDASNDTSLQQKRKVTAAYFKGRRNIRKVLDKKSLAKSTVVANMEEFERKRRLNIKQIRLREELGCEEGVNVLVINDEVCLEYDFEKHRPVVTIHPFFTKVMKAHQYEGVKFMWDACFESLESIGSGHGGGGCILAHCMGLGKTLQVLALLHTVLTHPGVGMQRVLVCCPLSTVLNWVDEIHKWIGPVTNQIKVFELSKLRKTYERAYQLEDWYNGGGIFIIGYELFRSLTTLDEFLDDVRPTIINKIRNALLDPGPDIIICDEGHLLKNDCSVLAVAMSRVATKRRIVLTGTPMQNNLREYYCMVNFVKPNLLGTYSEYSNRFENPIMNGQHRDSREEDIKLMKARTHILHKVLEGCLQRQEASVLYPYLPKKHEYTVFISLTKCQWDLYKHYLQNYGTTQKNKAILKDFHVLQKIWSHPQVLHNFHMRSDEMKARNKLKMEKLEDDLAAEDLNATEDIKPTATEVWWLQYLEDGAMLESLASSNKFATVFRILDESVALGDKVLIFSTSLSTMDTLEYFLKKMNSWSLGQEYYRLDGSVPAEVRQKWVREFNAEHNHKTKLFLISTRAGSLGLNMTAANRVIILDTSWNPAHDIQSIFRVYRFGQKKDCYIYRLVALGTMEQKIYERSVTKQAVACRVVDEQQIDRHYNMAELTELYKFDETGMGVAGGVAVGVSDVVLLRVARDAALHAVHEHDSLLRGSHEQGLPEHERNAAWMQFQQEHAHKQMLEEELQQALLLKQEELAKAVKPPKKQIAKLKIKLPEVKAETEESILPEPLPGLVVQPPPDQPRKGKGRSKKGNVVSCRIPIQPETAEPEGNRESDMIKKIADILLKHNFQNHQTPSEISALVARVRTIVATGQMEKLDSSDELTMSIAHVMLQNEANHTIPMPALTDIACEEIITSDPTPPKVKVPDFAREEIITSDPTPPKVKEEPGLKPKPKPKGRKKGVKRKGYVYEAIPSTSAAPPPEPDIEGSRTRRRAAIAAEKHFDTIPDTAVDTGDNDWHNDSDTDSATEISPPRNDKVVVKKEPPSETVFKVYAGKPMPITTYAPRNSAISTHLEESILLSDDDELPPPPRKKPGPARKKLEPVTQKQVPVAKEPQVEPKDPGVGVVPLHASLLSNKNFIKIVAHTYLSGNPMLDEDAATLAAQYSTFKALKEFASTGEDIKCGPIYDIAVKILGINVLKKLHQSNVKLATSEIIASHPLSSQDSSIPKEVHSKVAENVAENVADPPETKPVRLKIRIPPLPANLAAASVNPTASQANVVPVGLYKRAEDPNVNADECILPDDDIHITSDPAPAPPPPAPAPTPAAAPAPAPTPAAAPAPAPASTPAPAPAAAAAAAAPAPIVINRRNARRLLLSKVVSSAASPGASQPAQPPASAPKPTITTASFAKIPYSSERILSDLSAPISLDSDDDEPVQLKPAPVPISLTAVNQTPAMRAALQNQTNTSTAPMMLSSNFNTSTSTAPIMLSSNFNTSTSTAPIMLSSNFNTSTSTAPIILNSTYNTSTSTAPIIMNSNLNNMTSTPVMGGNIILVPADQFVPNNPVPVSLNQMNSTLPRMYSTPSVPPLAPQTPTKNVKKTFCKAGDIFRITDGGKIEVLNRKDLGLEESEPSPAPAPTLPSFAPESSPAANSATAKKPPPLQQKPEAVVDTPKIPDRTSARKDSSSSSSSDDDPLSILKNVVHIEADTNVRTKSTKQDDVRTDVAAKQDNLKNCVSKRSLLIKKQDTDMKTNQAATSGATKQLAKPTAAAPPAKPKQTNQTLKKPPVRSTENILTIDLDDNSEGQWHQVLSHNTTATPKPKPSHRVVIAERMPVKPKVPTIKHSVSKPIVNKPTVSKPQQKQPSAEQNKKPGRLVGSVDLTDLDGPESPKAAVNKTSNLQKKATTIVGTSKSIILCGSGKAKLSTAASKRDPVAKPAVKQTAPSEVKPEVKKRPAPVDTSTAKKKKTDKPMTLKDFDIDIDDIDDIIELD